MKIQIDRELLQNLYWNKNFSTYKIANLLGCTSGTIINRLKEFGVRPKSAALARMKYLKYDFDGDATTKAYILGFRLGDLNVYKPSAKSETIVARCHTTQEDQVDILKSLFGKFGQVTTSYNRGHFHTNCFLNNTFSFLLPKDQNCWNWIEDAPVFFAFLAGYTDAEGNFIINQGKARFKIDAYDVDALQFISGYLEKEKIRNKLRLIYKKNIPINNLVFKSDLWRLNINYADSVYKFITAIKPFLKHKKRIADAKLCLNNIISRKQNGTIK